MPSTHATATSKSAREKSSKKTASKKTESKQPAKKRTGVKTKKFEIPETPYELKEKLDAMDINDVWTLFRKDPNDLYRNYFMERFYPLVKYNADRIYSRLPDEVDIEDLISAGLFGLMDAIDKFDQERGNKFETYCAPRIRGAVLDELRSMDWVPRLVRSRSSKIDQARMRLEMQLGRKPTTDEISEHLGVDEEELKKILRDGSAVSVSSLSRTCYQTDSSKEVREIDIVEDERQANPLSEIQRRDLKNIITKGLSRAERLIVILYYYEEMTMKEIGLTLDLSESRVSQMHSSILARLKAQMQHREKEFEEQD